MRLALFALVTGVATLAASACNCQKRYTPGPPPTGPDGPAATPRTTAPAELPPVMTECAHKGSGKDFAVGPGKPFATLGDVPFESLKAGDTVRLHWRPEPYREKVMLGGVGTAEQPIRFCGVPGPKGELPVIDGENATTRPTLDFPFDGHQVRGLVIVGHKHADPWLVTPAYIVVEGLEIRNASEGMPFTDKAGKAQVYSAPAAGVFVQRAVHLTIRGCRVTNNNNGLFIGTSGAEELTQNVLIEHNQIWGNGSLTSYYHHNVYNEASDVIYQYNWLGPPRGPKGGSGGNNVKERSAGVTIRYNWIEDGSHLLDIVDAQEAQHTTRAMPSFHRTLVYGNVMVRTAPSGSIVHYGGDSGIFENYRKGTLVFAHNTVVVRNDDHPAWQATEVIELSTNEEQLEARNNVVFTTIAAVDDHPVYLLGDRDRVVAGIATLAGNWLSKGITLHAAAGRNEVRAKAQGFEASVFGTVSPFVDVGAGDFRPAPASPLVGAGSPLPAGLLPEGALARQYKKHQLGEARADAGRPAIGALAP